MAHRTLFRDPPKLRTFKVHWTNTNQVFIVKARNKSQLISKLGGIFGYTNTTSYAVITKVR